ncbi:MAG: hypothetical protein J0I28_09175 [Caulobacterales bacterium]|nr:hypothetical protein [Caulobacterales bacterium]
MADLTPLSEAGLQALDAAVKPTPLDYSLLTPAPANELSETIGRLVEALHAMQRPVGDDVGLRRESDLACKQLPILQKEGRDRVAAARRAGSLLWSTAQTLKADQQKLDTVIRVCQIAAGDAEAQLCDPGLLARFQHRRATLTALQASQAKTVEQLDLAIKLMMDLIERHAEIERLVLPIWQQAVLGAVQGGAQPRGGAAASA